EGIAGDFLPMVLKDQSMLYVNNHIIAKVDPVAGRMIWRADLGSDKKDNILQVVYDLDEKAAYVFGTLNKKASIVALDLATGKQLWNNEFKAKGSPVLTATRSGLVMSDEKN
ncbi:PQQ-binding-like beta-propeller repeat protein, partial [Arthrospira platensis SPKY1]|nr:PQQ-binding-like beta-propeller repeat protein [Arthrospira platensis SPKY1]